MGIELWMIINDDINNNGNIKMTKDDIDNNIIMMIILLFL